VINGVCLGSAGPGAGSIVVEVDQLPAIGELSAGDSGHAHGPYVLGDGPEMFGDWGEIRAEKGLRPVRRGFDNHYFTNDQKVIVSNKS
jgi:hypothetical protein